MPDAHEFDIPDPQEPDRSSPVGEISYKDAEKEQRVFTRFFSASSRDIYDWLLKFILKPALFVFVLAINCWWDWNVRSILWQAGRLGTGFHLSDSVLIALITTSMTNFLALVTIVAKHLYPSTKPERVAASTH
jgi:hypothetical protein